MPFITSRAEGFVPGVGPSPNRMLQARLFAYGDAHRYRLGINHTRLPVNAPNGVVVVAGSDVMSRVPRAGARDGGNPSGGLARSTAVESIPKHARVLTPPSALEFLAEEG